MSCSVNIFHEFVVKAFVARTLMIRFGRLSVHCPRACTVCGEGIAWWYAHDVRHTSGAHRLVKLPLSDTRFSLLQRPAQLASERGCTASSSLILGHRCPPHHQEPLSDTLYFVQHEHSLPRCWWSTGGLWEFCWIYLWAFEKVRVPNLWSLILQVHQINHTRCQRTNVSLQLQWEEMAQLNKSLHNWKFRQM